MVVFISKCDKDDVDEVVVGARQTKRAQRRREALFPALDVAHKLSASARQRRARVVGRVGVEALLDGARGDLQRAPPRRDLDGLEVDAVDATRPDQRLDFGDDLRVEAFFEPPFLAAPVEVASGPAVNCASHKRSLVSTNSRLQRRNSW